ALRERLTPVAATELIEDVGYRHAGWKNERGVVGALAAVGAWAAFDDWTDEHIAYREAHRRGTPREVDHESVFAAADAGYPAAREPRSVCRTLRDRSCTVSGATIRKQYKRSPIGSRASRSSEHDCS